jgi:iron complex transport system substrate-binding protein
VIPAVTEMLFALGAGDAVVGVSSFDRYPPEVATRARVGALVDPDFERILTLRPDLVIVYGTQTEFIDRLARAGIPTFRYEHAGLADVGRTIAAIGERVGRATEARELNARIERDIAAIRTAVAARPRPRTAVLFEREPGTLRTIYASGGTGFLHDMLDAAGGADVFGDVKRQSLQVSTETLLARAPEVILELLSPDSEYPPERVAREREVWNALAALPAVRGNRVYLFADSRIGVPGPRVAEAIRILARALHGDVVK